MMTLLWKNKTVVEVKLTDLRMIFFHENTVLIYKIDIWDTVVMSQNM